MNETIFEALDRFVEECKKRLKEKESDGWAGWDSRDQVDDLDLLNRASNNLNECDYPDAANLVMMLWARNHPLPLERINCKKCSHLASPDYSDRVAFCSYDHRAINPVSCDEFTDED